MITDRTGMWDYVIVGGGSAGAALAARISEDTRTRVLVLEAGPDWRATDAPPAIRRSERIDEVTSDLAAYGRWHWLTITARRTSIQDIRPYRQGAGFGGSSLINGMVALRPPLADFDAWAAAGCAGWSARDILAAFVRLEDDQNFGDKPYHGRAGPIPIYRADRPDWGHVDRAFCEAAMALGHPWNPDQNAPEPAGVGAYPGNLHEGERVTSYDSYLEAVRDRANLMLQGNSLVDRVLFDQSGRAVGLRYRYRGEWVDLECGKVVLCAGAIGSAAILIRSGIGPADDLRQFGIDVVVDIPVGQRLQDHPMLAVAIAAPALGGRAPGRGYEVVLRASSNTVDSAPSEYAVHPVHGGSVSSPTVALFVFLHRCDSRGVLRLRSPDPTVAPALDERMLSDIRDLARMRAAVRHTIELARRPELRSSGQRIGLTGAEWSAEDIADDRILDALLLAEVTDAKHVAATCPMGRPGADGVVVDPHARVVGVTGLRVADCSIMPTVPRANTYLTAVMIGERVAELIRGEAEQPVAETQEGAVS